MGSLNLAGALGKVPGTAFLEEPGYFVWGASMLRDTEGTCHLLYSRWPHGMGFHAWVTHSEIAHAVSANPLGPYEPADVALAPRGIPFWDGLCTHSPTAIAVDGKYYLYYMGTHGLKPPKPALEWEDFNFEFRNNQRLGVAVAEHPAGPWRRLDAPIIDVSMEPEAPDALCTANPAVTQRREGDFLMVYKAVARREALPFGGPVVHCMALAQRPEGPFVKQPGLAFTVPGDSFPAEDPFIWYHGEQDLYYAVLKDMRGAFTGVGPSLALFFSRDGLDWSAAKYPLVCGTEIPWALGKEKVSRLERPQIWLEGGCPRLLFCAVRRDDGHAFNVHIPLEGLNDE